MSGTPKTLVLIVLTGSKDFKLWTNPADPEHSVSEVPPFCNSTVHQCLMDGLSGGTTGQPGTPLWRVCATAAELPDTVLDASDAADRKRLEALPGWSDAMGPTLEALDREFGRGRDRERSLSPLFDERGRILLHPAKLGGLVRSLENAGSSIDVARVLAFASDRRHLSGDSDTNGRKGFVKEPFASGALTARWLADRLPELEYHQDRQFDGRGTGWVNVLKSDEKYDGKEGSKDHPVRRRVAAYIEQAIAEVADHCSDAFPIVSTTGGFGDMKPLIAEAVALHFRHPVTNYIATEENPDAPLDVERIGEPLEFAPITDSLAARAHARRRIQEGDLPGAWGAVAHLVRSKPDDGWLNTLQRAVEFIDGRSPADPDGVQLLADPMRRELLRAAFRVESALQGRPEDQRPAQALLATTAFIETALFAAVTKSLDCLGFLCSGEELKPDPEARGKLLATIQADGYLARRKLADNESTTPEQIKNAQLTIAASLVDRIKEDQPGKPWSLKTQHVALRNWRHWLIDQPNGSPDHKRGLAIEKFECLLFAPLDEPLVSLRDLRNALSHATLNETQLKQLSALATREVTIGMTSQIHDAAKAKPTGPLWKLDQPADAPAGGCFLEQPAALAVFQAFGIDDPGARYRDFLHAVEEQLLTATTEPKA